MCITRKSELNRFKYLIINYGTQSHNLDFYFPDKFLSHTNLKPKLNFIPAYIILKNLNYNNTGMSNIVIYTVSINDEVNHFITENLKWNNLERKIKK